ncbi:hypothetical protein LWI29_007616 [Acer saccharum]|uniref:Disease resistance RPP13-like protein 1 n=1 Tax=Acer saccharum TaxID=4024 RepID=A0AA39RC56_ACESA|nr:hypothetical protein LWI29_007616 [Acer saccharum]
MPVVELFLSAFLQVLFDRLASRELLKFLRQEGLYSEIKKWGETLKMIQDVLGDAEEKQLKEMAVKTWLNDLQDLAYDIDDILDEFATEALARKLKMEQQQSSKVWKLIPVHFSCWRLGSIMFNIRMRSKVTDVTSRFKGLKKLRHDLGLKVTTGEASSNAAPKRPPSTSHPIEPAVYGRDGDKAKILKMVLKNEPTDHANFLVIPIVGMGGVGKTTLAREVFNDPEVESFEIKAWVYVSEDFDVTRISKSILENITGSSCNQNDLTTVQNGLKHKVTGKKFLLVLDDIWSKDYSKWETLKSPFMAGAAGSRIIVTTRLQEVALTIKPSGFYPLDILQYEDCWLVFAMHAFENGVIPAQLNIELIHQKVIEKSKGLPLAAKTLGVLLRSKQTEEWLKILNSKLWDLSENDESGIPAALKLSYHHLPSHLKRCFAYCSIFPKDYEFEEEELILLWMAEGLLQESTENTQPEDSGHEYFHDLLSRSMFQQSGDNNNCSKFGMHDLVHDLAQWAFGEISLRLDDVLGGNNKLPRGLEKVRHFSYTVDEYDGQNKFAIFHEAEFLKTRIRTFLPIVQRGVFDRYITSMAPFDLLPKLRRLRVLSLRSYYISELPNSIGGLKHLRYLNLSSTKITSLPESTSLLYNLQILMLRDCSCLAKLPSNLRYLIKLRHFDIRGAILIKEMPSGMQKLESLQKLSNFIVGKGVGSNLKDLKSLKKICGELCISRLENVKDDGSGDLILRDKEDLKDLLLEWGSDQFDESRSEIVEKNVLDILRPHENLEKLTIKCYGGTRFPSWVGDSSFSKMTVLRLKSCEKCTSLPSLVLLSLLKDLTIEGIKGLKHIGSEIYGESHSKPFQSLEILCFEDLPEWEIWEPINENEYVDTFPCLRKLSIVKCPKLSGKLPKQLPSLERLVIKNCEQLVISFSSIPLLCKLELHGFKRMACNSPMDFNSLKSMSLSIMGYEQLLTMWQQNQTCLEESAKVHFFGKAMY